MTKRKLYYLKHVEETIKDSHIQSKQVRNKFNSDFIFNHNHRCPGCLDEMESSFIDGKDTIENVGGVVATIFKGGDFVPYALCPTCTTHYHNEDFQERIQFLIDDYIEAKLSKLSTEKVTRNDIKNFNSYEIQFGPYLYNDSFEDKLLLHSFILIQDKSLDKHMILEATVAFMDGGCSDLMIKMLKDDDSVFELLKDDEFFKFAKGKCVESLPFVKTNPFLTQLKDLYIKRNLVQLHRKGLSLTHRINFKVK